MLDINENTRLLFLQALNEIDSQLKNYAKRADANADYIKKRNRQIQDIFNFYNEVETVLQNLKFNRDIFLIERTGADEAELNRLRAENRKLREQVNGMYTKKPWYGSPQEREAFRAYHNARQRDIYGY